MSAISKGAIFASLAWSGVSRGALAVAEFRSSARLLLNFLSGTLDSRITFSRGTNATLIDSTGKLTYAPNNLLTFSTDATNAAWTKASTTVVGGVSDPLGGTSAQTVTATAAAAQLYNFLSIGSAIGTRYLFSVWVRRRSGSGVISLFNPNATATAIAVTSTWTQFFVSGNGGSGFVYPGLLISSSGDQIDIYFPVCAAITYETAPRPADQVATTASAYYGPRFDYDPVTLAPRGLLIEEARTNLLTYSDDWSNAAWVKGGATVTANVTASPDGTNNADKLVETAITGVHEISQAGGVTSGTTYVYSVFAKQGERNRLRIQMDAGRFPGTALAFFDLVTGAPFGVGAGATALMTNCGNGWFRCILVSTATVSGAASTYSTLVSTGTTFSYTGDGTSGLYLYGAQFEAGSFATSYIPTVASTVTRNADVATMTGTNFSSWYNQSEGTFVTDASMLALNTVITQELLSLDDGSVANSIALRSNNTAGDTSSTASTASVSQGFLNIAGAAAGIAQKVAHGIKLNDAALVRNGGAVTTDATYAVPVGLTRMAIGQRTSGFAQINGHIRTIAYFNTRLPNAQLQTLTAPSLATTLHVDFTSGSYLVGF